MRIASYEKCGRRCTSADAPAKPLVTRGARRTAGVDLRETGRRVCVVEDRRVWRGEERPGGAESGAVIDATGAERRRAGERVVVQPRKGPMILAGGFDQDRLGSRGPGCVARVVVVDRRRVRGRGPRRRPRRYELGTRADGTRAGHPDDAARRVWHRVRMGTGRCRRRSGVSGDRRSDQCGPGEQLTDRRQARPRCASLGRRHG